jgi:hypothetical protein
MTVHPARDMHRMVQKPERPQNSITRVDMTRPSYMRMSGCVNLRAAHGHFCGISFRARTTVRDNVDRIDAIMIMRRTPSLRLSRFDPQKAACPGNRRRGKTGIVRRFHLILHQMTAM